MDQISEADSSSRDDNPPLKVVLAAMEQRRRHAATAHPPDTPQEVWRLRNYQQEIRRDRGRDRAHGRRAQPTGPTRPR